MLMRRAAVHVLPARYLDTRPYVGLSPTTPQKCAGWRMLPPVSLPSAAAHCPAATAAALPPLLPPGTRPASQGLRVTCAYLGFWGLGFGG